MSEKQEKCDHIIGVVPDGMSYEPETVRMSELHKYSMEIPDRSGYMMDDYNYCPMCGAKLDWDEIREYHANQRKIARDQQDAELRRKYIDEGWKRTW